MVHFSFPLTLPGIQRFKGRKEVVCDDALVIALLAGRHAAFHLPSPNFPILQVIPPGLPGSAILQPGELASAFGIGKPFRELECLILNFGGDQVHWLPSQFGKEPKINVV